ncbi:MAG: hypothetical protein KJ675_06075 [Gammaproteobacteria bacterium]|nr:hypothetical protein [Gammaproteobacteria bacterium]
MEITKIPFANVIAGAASAAKLKDIAAKPLLRSKKTVRRKFAAVYRPGLAGYREHLLLTRHEKAKFGFYIG